MKVKVVRAGVCLRVCMYVCYDASGEFFNPGLVALMVSHTIARRNSLHMSAGHFAFCDRSTMYFVPQGEQFK